MSRNLSCNLPGSHLSQGFHKLFAYGRPDRGREFEKKEREKTFEKII